MITSNIAESVCDITKTWRYVYMCKNPVDLIIKHNKVILKPDEVNGMDPRMLIDTDENNDTKKQKGGKEKWKMKSLST